MREEAVIDLHIHSTNSDGTYTTQQLLDQLKDLGAKYVSFTDHDSVGSYLDIREGRARVPEDMTVITGVELTCWANGGRKDVLGYNVNIDVINGYLEPFNENTYLLNKQTVLLHQFKEKCRKLGLKFSEEVAVKTGKKAEAYHVLSDELRKHPENKEILPDIYEDGIFYWKHYANPESELFVDESYDRPTFGEAVKLIHGAGGLAFLAHPYLYSDDEEKVCELLKAASNAGIDGIELHHSTNKDGYVDRLKKLASPYNFLYSGGSDYHGTRIQGLNLITGHDNMFVEVSDLPWLKSIKPFSC